MMEYITVEDLLNNLPDHSFIQCVECERWKDIGAKGSDSRQREGEMSKEASSAFDQEMAEVAAGRGRGYSTCRDCRQAIITAAKSTLDHLSEALSDDERKEAEKRFGPRDSWECSIKKDEDGYYCATHRARSDSYESIDKIPKSRFDFIGSTG